MHQRIKRPERRYGINFFEKPNSPLAKRSYPIGHHRGKVRRKYSNSSYGKRLVERQKIRVLYNIKSGLLDTYIKGAMSCKKPDIALLARLESRFDQTVFKLGFAPSIHSARQLVSHKHFLINGKSVNIPSYHMKPNDVISVREKSQQMAIINRCVEVKAQNLPAYLKKQSPLVGVYMRNLENKEELMLHFNISPTAVIESLR